MQDLIKNKTLERAKNKMLAKKIYKIWAPVGAKWVDWVRPVPFIGINEKMETFETGEFKNHLASYIQALNTYQNNMKNEVSSKEFNLKTNNINSVAIIIDLPGIDSIKEGLAVAQMGFRPIPIYNGTEEQLGAMPTVDNSSIKIGLLKGALELKKIKLDKDAPPAFLLDSNRTNRYKMTEAVFDNSWDVYAQDMPSAEYFLSNKINKIIVIGKKLQKDLQKILYGFQRNGIKIFFSSEYGELKEIKIKKPKVEKDDF